MVRSFVEGVISVKGKDATSEEAERGFAA